jgi:hypothetical protein
MKTTKFKFSLELKGDLKHVSGMINSLLSALEESIESNSPKPINFFLRERLSKVEKRDLRLAIIRFQNQSMKGGIQNSEKFESSFSQSSSEIFLEFHRNLFKRKDIRDVQRSKTPIDPKNFLDPKLFSKKTGDIIRKHTLLTEKENSDN